MKNKIKFALIQQALLRWENAVLIALAILLTAFLPQPFDFWPVWGWGVLALVVLALAVYRMSIASREDDQIHLSAAESNVSTMQAAFAQKLETLDKLGKSLTIVAVVYGAGLLIWAIRDAWVSGSMMPK